MMAGAWARKISAAGSRSAGDPEPGRCKGRPTPEIPRRRTGSIYVNATYRPPRSSLPFQAKYGRRVIVEYFSMQDRRQGTRDKVIFGGLAAINERGSTVDCVVRNFSDRGACVELDGATKLPDEINLAIPRKGRSFFARMIWRQANRVGLAFRIMTTTGEPVSDLDERLRRSEQKKRQLQRRIKELLGEG
jgi:hypothetical protein